MTFSLQPVMRWACEKLEGFWRIIVADIFLFVSFVGTVNGEYLVNIEQNIRAINYNISQFGVEFGHFWIVTSYQVRAFLVLPLGCNHFFEFPWQKTNF